MSAVLREGHTVGCTVVRRAVGSHPMCQGDSMVDKVGQELCLLWVSVVRRALAVGSLWVSELSEAAASVGRPAMELWHKWAGGSGTGAEGKIRAGVL